MGNSFQLGCKTSEANTHLVGALTLGKLSVTPHRRPSHCPQALDCIRILEGPPPNHPNVPSTDKGGGDWPLHSLCPSGPQLLQPLGEHGQVRFSALCPLPLTHCGQGLGVTQHEPVIPWRLSLLGSFSRWPEVLCFVVWFVPGGEAGSCFLSLILLLIISVRGGRQAARAPASAPLQHLALQAPGVDRPLRCTHGEVLATVQSQWATLMLQLSSAWAMC